VMAAEGSVEALGKSLKSDGRFAKGLNAYKGKITYQSVAKDLDLTDKYQDVRELF